MLLKDINPGSASSNPDNLSAIGSTVYFSATDPAHGREIWKTDGSVSGTMLFLDYLPGPSSYTDEDHFISTDGKILFTIPNPFDNDLYSTDGTVAGTVKLMDGASSGATLSGFIHYAGDVYFGEELLSSVYGPLQRTDGTIGGTGPVPYTVSQTNSSNPQSMVKFPGGGYLFDADDGIHGNELWITNGTPAGTSLLKDINPGITSTIYSFGPELNDKLLFAASTPDGNVGKEQTLWITDGTESGTERNLNPDADSARLRFVHPAHQNCHQVQQPIRERDCRDCIC
jgi:ELWxxDGT repeat protein